MAHGVFPHTRGCATLPGVGGSRMLEQKWTCPQCSHILSPEDTVIFGNGRVSHLDCKQPHILSAEERALLSVYCQDHQVGQCAPCGGRYALSEFVSDLLSGQTHLCPRCRRDLTNSVRAHLYDCVVMPAEVRRKAQVARETAQRLVKRSRQLGDAADVLTREAEAALAALRESMRQSLQIRSNLRNRNPLVEIYKGRRIKSIGRPAPDAQGRWRVYVVVRTDGNNTLCMTPLSFNDARTFASQAEAEAAGLELGKKYVDRT
jgi:hypothetical protein